jgi:hypothetical protein
MTGDAKVFTGERDKILDKIVLDYAAIAAPGYGDWSRRLVRHPGHYITFRAFADRVGLGMGSAEVFRTKGMREEYEKLLRSAWPDIAVSTLGIEHQWQSYLVSKPIFDALTLTDAPAIWDLEGATKMPFDAVFFLLHDQCFKIDGEPVAVVACGHLNESTRKRLRFANEDGSDSFLVVGYTPSGRVFFNNQRVTNGKVDAYADTSFTSLYDRDEDYTMGEQEATRALVPLALQFITVLNNCDNLVERGRVTGHVGKLSRGTRKETAEPGWLGRRFVLHSQHDSPSPKGSPAAGDGHPAGEGRSVRPHFRRGHWRGIRHGQGRKLLRQEWIQPCFVNAKSA